MDGKTSIAYIERTRSYYLGLGYGTPYRWARFNDIAFNKLARPLAECRVALVTTAAPFRPELADQGPGAPYNGAAKFFDVYTMPVDGKPDVRISHIAYDRVHTSAEDPNCWFPLNALKEAHQAGRIGAVSRNFYGVPTNRSHRVTAETDCPNLLRHIQADGADAAIIVPNCPVCHQSAAFAANHLEAAGVATVVMGCAKDIIEHAGVPRFLFSDFPLGNGAGKPHDRTSQNKTLSLALDLLESAQAPGTTHISPLRWADNDEWKMDYCNIDLLSAEEIAARRANFDAQKTAAKSTNS